MKAEIIAVGTELLLGQVGKYECDLFCQKN
jgi:molybdopterin-biosynthesis enzyme MoeA-like protein